MPARTIFLAGLDPGCGLRSEDAFFPWMHYMHG